MKNLAAMQPPPQASKLPHEAQAPGLDGSRSEVNRSEERQMAAKPPSSWIDPALNSSWSTNGQA